jgi:hypothetical protein
MPFDRRLTLAALVLSATLHAADKPTPPPSSQPQTRPGPVTLARPDLVVTIEGGGAGFPKSFTVKNIGSADSRLSVLKVSAAFVPPDGPLAGVPGAASCDPPMTQAQCDVAAAFAGLFGAASPDPKVACGEPFKEIVEAVPVLKPGESKTFARDTGPAFLLVRGLMRPAGSTQGTHLKKCPPTLTCAFDVVARADASNDNEELNKANNTATLRVFRDVKYQ